MPEQEHDLTVVIPSRKKAAALGFLLIGGIGALLSYLLFMLLGRFVAPQQQTQLTIAKIISISFGAFGIIGMLIGLKNPTYCAGYQTTFFNQPEHSPEEAETTQSHLVRING